MRRRRRRRSGVKGGKAGKLGWSWWAGKHVSAHFTAQAFSLNKMLSGGEKATDKKQRQLMKGKGKARDGYGWLGGWCGWCG